MPLVGKHLLLIQVSTIEYYTEFSTKSRKESWDKLNCSNEKDANKLLIKVWRMI